MVGVPNEHFETYFRYLYQVLLQSMGSEIAMNVLVDDRFIVKPIKDSLKDLRVNVGFFYGDRDFMNFRNVEKVPQTF